MFLIICYCFLTDETYIEQYNSRKEQIQGLEELIERDDINLEEGEFEQIIENNFYSYGYDSITLKKA